LYKTRIPHSIQYDPRVSCGIPIHPSNNTTHQHHTVSLSFAKETTNDRLIMTTQNTTSRPSVFLFFFVFVWGTLLCGVVRCLVVTPTTRSYPILRPTRTFVSLTRTHHHHHHHHHRFVSGTTLGAAKATDDSSSSSLQDEWHPHDPAESTPQLLAGLWHQIAQANTMIKGVRSFVHSYIRS